jgi:rare lipoprotein A
VRQKFLQISFLLGLGTLLVACSSGPQEQVICIDGTCTPAPKKATSRPYQIKGIWYYPQLHFEYDEVGLASYYGGGRGYDFHGRPTATGEIFDMNDVSAAHKTLPLPCIVEVTNLENGRQIQLKVNDRGPFVEGRIIDVSRRTAQLLGFEGKGTAKVRVRTLLPDSLALNGMDASKVMLAQKAPPAMELAAAPVALAALPRLPDTLFEEEESLPVLAEASTAQPIQPKSSEPVGIFVHVGGYESQREALALSQRLDVVTQSPAKPIKSNGPKPYAVRVGPFPSMGHANQVLDQLADAGHAMSRIVINR